MATDVVELIGAEAVPPTDFIGTIPQREEVGLEFFRALRHSRLMSESEVRAMEEDFHTYPQQTLADLFLRTGRLTRYQFDVIQSGEPQVLVLGPYRILDELGRGGGGTVFRACHTVLDRVVALKVIDPRYTQGRSAQEVFRREVAATTRLSHPNIVQVYDANECDGLFYLAMELIAGSTLHRYVADTEPLSAPAACEVLYQLALALEHAHKKGLVHRDIKPANIMLMTATGSEDRDGVKVLDFGLARLMPTAEQRIATLHCPEGAAMGTPAFMSPEQIRSFHETDIRSDLYSLGCTLYYALTGQLPFDGPTGMALFKQLNHEAAPIRSVNPAVPCVLAGIVHRLMAKKPADRFQSPTELLDALNGHDLISDQPTAVVVTPSPEVSGVTPAVCRGGDGPPPRAVGPIPAVSTKLVGRWDDWCEIIASGTRDDRPLTATGYREFHRDLMDLIHAAKSGETGLPADVLDWIESHAEPWVTFDSLLRLDDRTRLGLYRACTELGMKLSPTFRRPPRDRSWLLGVVAAACAAAAAWVWLRPPI